MTSDPFWKLFFATGLPQAYLAARKAELREHPPLEEAQTAFLPLTSTSFRAERQLKNSF